MAVRNFDGAADLLVCSIGGLASVDGGANTYAVLIKVTTTKDQGVLNVHDSAAAQHQGLVLLTTTGDIGYQSGLGGQDIALAVPTATWGVAAVTKAAGTSTPRAHWCVLGGANTHTNAGGTVADYGANDLAGGSVRFGGAGFGDYDGRIAAAGALSSVLSDTQIESLKTSWANWVALFTGSTAGLWRFDQTDTAQNVNDQTPNGANQTSLTGTTVVTGDDPPGFDWGAAGAPYSPDPLSVFRLSMPALQVLRGGDAGTTAAAAATGSSTDTDRTSGTAAGVKGATGAAQSGTRTSGVSTGIKGATGASTGQQRAVGVVAAVKQATGVATGPQRSSGQPVGKKAAIAAAVGQQHGLGAAAGGVKAGVGAATGPVRSIGVAATAVAVVIVPGFGTVTAGGTGGTVIVDATGGTTSPGGPAGTVIVDATGGTAKPQDTGGRVTVG